MVNWTAAFWDGTYRSCLHPQPSSLLVQAPEGARLLRARSHFIPKRYVLRRAVAGSSYTLPQKYCRNQAITQAQTQENGDGVQDPK